MSGGFSQFAGQDVPAVLAAVLAAVACAVPGNFLLLRRQALLGDAISHAVLPGLVLAFLIGGSRAPLAMFLGAAAAGLVCAGLSEAVRRLGRVDPGAAMGVVFSVLFALGVVLVRRYADNVDLDADCVLNGQLEYIIRLPGEPMPRQVWVLGGVCAAACVVVALLWKELRLASFDAALADSLGFPSIAVSAVLMAVTAGAVVASFEAVGSILVIAMLIVPAATARMFTERLLTQVLLSTVLAAASAVAGYALAASAPSWAGTEKALSASGMIATVSGAGLLIAMLLSPSHGWAARRVRSASLSVRIAAEDMLGLLFRSEERGVELGERPVRGEFPLLIGVLAVRRLRRAGLIVPDGAAWRLTETGRAAAGELVRSHRLWETYLVSEAGIRADHVHPTAEQLEHVAGVLPSVTGTGPDGSITDPHGRTIPGAGR